MMEKETQDTTTYYSLTPRRIPPQNIVNRLHKRETFGHSKPGTHFHALRRFYQNVFPNFTVINVEKPPCFLRKFSPDGQYFIAFSADQTSLEIYEYQGSAAAADLLDGLEGDYIGNKSDKQSDVIRGLVFERFFKIKYTVNVAQSGEQLNRECSLFTDDGRYVIIGSAAFIPEDLYPDSRNIYSSNEAVAPSPRSTLEDYSLHLVDLQDGKLCDTKNFKGDKIYLSHNQGLYLYKDTLAVLSVQHQTIHILNVVDGLFLNVLSIGQFCYQDDEYIVSRTTPPLPQTGSDSNWAYTDVIISALKHRLLVFLYHRAQDISRKTNHPYELRKFYQYFEQFRSLRMWKMQLLDENHLLIKYASDDVVTMRVSDPNSQPSFFVVYNIYSTKVLAVYENTSEELLELFENCCDLFRNAKLHSESQFTCSPSNNVYARLIQRYMKQVFISARFGGPTEATKRLLSQLPISSQSYSSSPYLDLSLFSYNDKLVSAMERPKACGEYPIRFFDRDSGLLKFQIYAGVLGKSPPPQARRLVAFTFHPTDPFAISVQRTNAEYVVNFHIRNV